MDKPGHVFARKMRSDLTHSGLELHSAVCRYEVTRLRQLLRSPEPETLRALGKPVHEWGTPLHVAVWCDAPGAVQVLLEAGADPELELDDFDSTPWELAAGLGRREILRRFWPLFNYHPSAVDCLQRASSNGHVATVRDMLDRRRDWYEGEMTCALKAAAAEWRDNVAEMLLFRFTYPVSRLNEALVVACNLKPLQLNVDLQYDAFDSLYQQQLVARLIRAGAEPNAPRARGGLLHLVHLTASMTTLTGALKALLENGGDASAKDAFGRSALHGLGWPVHQRERGQETARINYTAANLLISHGASPLQRDEDGNTPLHYAASGSDLHLFAVYTSACSADELDTVLHSPSNNGETPLHWAAGGSKVDILEYLIFKGADIHRASNDNWTPVMCAMAGHGSSTDVARATALLLFHGADPLVVTAQGWTALHALARRFDGNKDSQIGHIAEQVILRGADVEARAAPLKGMNARWAPGKPWRGKNGFAYRGVHAVRGSEGTPLHWAAEDGALGVARALMAHGADGRARNGDGKMPVELARKAGTQNICGTQLSGSVVGEFVRLVEGGTVSDEVAMAEQPAAS